MKAVVFCTALFLLLFLPTSVGFSGVLMVFLLTLSSYHYRIGILFSVIYGFASMSMGLDGWIIPFSVLFSLPWFNQLNPMFMQIFRCIIGFILSGDIAGAVLAYPLYYLFREKC